MAVTINIRSRWLSRLAVLAIVLGLIMLVFTGRALQQARDYNQALAEGDWQRAAQHLSAYGELAAAYDLAGRQPAEENFQETVRAFARVTTATDEPRLRQLARYDLATLYLERGLQLLAAEQPDQATPLLELAKGMYRERLRVDPEHWDSKYNLEQALRAAPDAEEEEPPPELRNPGPSSRAVGAGRGKRQLP
jgi:mxaK protein